MRIRNLDCLGYADSRTSAAGCEAPLGAKGASLPTLLLRAGSPTVTILDLRAMVPRDSCPLGQFWLCPINAANRACGVLDEQIRFRHLPGIRSSSLLPTPLESAVIYGRGLGTTGSGGAGGGVREKAGCSDCASGGGIKSGGLSNMIAKRRCNSLP